MDVRNIQPLDRHFRRHIYIVKFQDDIHGAPLPCAARICAQIDEDCPRKSAAVVKRVARHVVGSDIQFDNLRCTRITDSFRRYDCCIVRGLDVRRQRTRQWVCV